MTLPPLLSRLFPGEPVITPPIISLLFANLTTIVFAIAGHWNAATVMFIYWAQSGIIGIFTVASLLSADIAALRSDMVKSQIENGGSGDVSPRFVRFYTFLLAGFFALHYGLFHWAYFSFIVDTGLFGAVDFSNPEILIACLFFFINHLFSYFYHRKDEWRGAGFVTEEFFRPYRRIIPMHLTIIFGSIIVFALTMTGIEATMPVMVLFLLLKTYADLGAHMNKHSGNGQIL
ncbi:MAG: hypothetical protein A4E35_01398 [Methanoregula sp. PtaU1.Bin051]|nr:MAG: hypothetical protein A4E35_01398 [Methanoregula sp. PtaU1.Bin051]